MGLPPLSKIPFILRPQAWLHRRHYGEVLSPIRWWGRIPFIFYLVSMFCPFRSNQLCCRSDFNTFSLVFYRHRAWSITGDYCLFLGGQHVNRRYFLVCHRTVYSVCPDRGDFYGEENMA